MEAHSISAGLDYPGVGPEHSYLKDTGRARYVGDHRRRGAGSVSDCSAAAEGIIPALESSHAVAHALPLARRLGPDRTLLVSLSGRGDKDLQTAADALGMSL